MSEPAKPWLAEEVPADLSRPAHPTLRMSWTEPCESWSVLHHASNESSQNQKTHSVGAASHNCPLDEALLRYKDSWAEIAVRRARLQCSGNRLWSHDSRCHTKKAIDRFALIPCRLITALERACPTLIQHGWQQVRHKAHQGWHSINSRTSGW